MQVHLFPLLLWSFDGLFTYPGSRRIQYKPAIRVRSLPQIADSRTLIPIQEVI